MSAIVMGYQCHPGGYFVEMLGRIYALLREYVRLEFSCHGLDYERHSWGIRSAHQLMEQARFHGKLVESEICGIQGVMCIYS